MIYRALSNTQYTFTTTNTITIDSGIDNPLIPNLPRILVTKSSETYYVPLVPVGTNTAVANFTTGKSTSSPLSSSWTATSALPTAGATPQLDKITIDGATYYGYRNCRFGFADYRSASSTTLPEIVVSPVQFRVVKYVVSSGLVVTETYSISQSVSIPSITTSSQNTLAIQYMYIDVPKQSSDLIIGLFAEYTE